MTENRQYIKFMSDIIDSGVWGKLSSAARTLYPVLLKFSDQNFKPVWPSTDTLMHLTGFKNKKSIIQAKRDLMAAGLMHFISGTGRKNSQYYFTFNHREGNSPEPLGWTKSFPRGDVESLSGVAPGDAVGGSQANPNNINITITNNNQITKKKEDESETKIEKLSYESLIEDYGLEVFSFAFATAKKKGLENNINYLRGICKNKIQENVININPSKAEFNPPMEKKKASWRDFILWAKDHLTSSSAAKIGLLEIEIDGDAILIKGETSDLLKNVILKYFNEESDAKVFIVFSDNKEEKRVSFV